MHEEDRRRPAGRALERMVRRCMVAAAASLMVSAGGCSSGSDDGPPPAPTSIVVTARDVFGVPVPGATITIFRDAEPPVSLVADEGGRAETAGDYRNVLGVSASATDLYGASYEPKQSTNDRLEFVVIMHPSAALTGAMAPLQRAAPPTIGFAYSCICRIVPRSGNSLLLGSSYR